MDTTKTPVKSAEEVEAVIATIKTKMPRTYAAIQAKAQDLGKAAFALVRSAIKGQPNCFYANEAGWVVGTRFDQSEISRDVAQLLVCHGVDHFIVWPEHAVQQQIKTGAQLKAGA